MPTFSSSSSIGEKPEDAPIDGDPVDEGQDDDVIAHGRLMSAPPLITLTSAPRKEGPEYHSFQQSHEVYAKYFFDDDKTTRISRNSSETTGDDTFRGYSCATNDDEEHSSIATAGTSNTPASRHRSALPESISWRVARSWELIADNLEAVGVKFFLLLFEEHPELLELFHFGGTDLSTATSLPAPLKLHALVVMQTLGECVSGKVKVEDLVPKLRAIGQAHATSGVQDYHYPIMLRS